MCISIDIDIGTIPQTEHSELAGKRPPCSTYAVCSVISIGTNPRSQYTRGRECISIDIVIGTIPRTIHSELSLLKGRSLKQLKTLQAQWLKTHEQTFTSILVMLTYLSVSTHFSIYILKEKLCFLTFLPLHMFTTVAPSTGSGRTIQKLSHCPYLPKDDRHYPNPSKEEVDQAPQRQLSLLHRRVHAGVVFAIHAGRCLESSELPCNRLCQNP